MTKKYLIKKGKLYFPSKAIKKNAFVKSRLFYYQDQGSLIEAKNQILIAKDVDYLKEEDFQKIAGQINIAHKLLQGLIQKTKSFINLKS